MKQGWGFVGAAEQRYEKWRGERKVGGNWEEWNGMEWRRGESMGFLQMKATSVDGLRT
jgi:hypothetical protein